ncbi:hypothetical protein ACTWPT_54965 [Nonomuraea sp. 3N208]|uniref:hypothetical protein n=1 Tax=unclassified Nonomuraea TaxID=2593643 RepID=UPI00273BEED7|nr:hypothetical protein [Nonomuraea sp. G32]MDP4502667.1 hypothetical protein [Nonomuraea sp. G32]
MPRVAEKQVIDGVGTTVAIELDARAVSAPTGPRLPYSQATLNSGTPTRATAIPYVQEDNRDGRAMRVWVPTE